MSPGLGRVILALSSAGFPLTQIAIRRLGRRGAVVVEAVAVGLLARDAALIATGAPRRLRRGPAALLWLKAGVAALAAVLGKRLISDETARQHALDSRPSGIEAARRASVGALFGLHTLRFRIYLSPDHGRRRA